MSLENDAMPLGTVESDFESLLADHHPNIQQWARAVCGLVLEIQPSARLEVERAWGGYLLFKQPVSGGNTVCFVSAHSKHVSVGFSEGARLEDPTGLLQGKGKLQRHVKIKRVTELENPGLRNLIANAWSRQPESEVLAAAVERLRELCLGLPRTSETISQGHPTFKVGKKSFAVYGISSPSIAFRADMELQAELQGNDRYFPTPYMANKGWFSVRVDEQTNWVQVERFVIHSHGLAGGKLGNSLL